MKRLSGTGEVCAMDHAGVSAPTPKL